MSKPANFVLVAAGAVQRQAELWADEAGDQLPNIIYPGLDGAELVDEEREYLSRHSKRQKFVRDERKAAAVVNKGEVTP